MSQDVLTKDQQQAVKDILAFIQDDRQAIILEGFAGTGKTFVINHVYEQYEQLRKLNKFLNLGHKKWLFTATTHKAVASLAATTHKEVQTVHSLFHISIMDTQREPFECDKDTIVIVDECSYLNYEQLEILLRSPCKFIFMGDRLQLPPVGLNHSPVFFMDFEVISLTTLVRQKNAPLIADYCEKLRDSIKNFKSTPAVPNNSEIIHLDRKHFDNQMLNVFDAHLDSKFVCFRNSTVKKYNKKIQTYLTGSPDIKVGDLLVNNERTSLLRNNQYVSVSQVSKTSFLGRKGTMVNNTYFVPDKPAQFKNVDSPHITDLRHTFASTIHKAQGSTYHTVFIDLTEFNQVRTREDINRLLYVAVSRATHRIYVTGELP